jgi:hypothetical protein
VHLGFVEPIPPITLPSGKHFVIRLLQRSTLGFVGFESSLQCLERNPGRSPYCTLLPPNRLPSFAEATGVNPRMNARWVPSVVLAPGLRSRSDCFGGVGKEGTLRRVPPYEACGEVPRP